MSDFSSTLRCLLSESRKLKSLVIDQAEFGRDADWFELIKLTCEQIGPTFVGFLHTRMPLNFFFFFGMNREIIDAIY
jgi:hypothetical protein